MTKQSPDFWRKVAAMLVAKHGGVQEITNADAERIDGKTLVVVEAEHSLTLHTVTPERAAAMARELEESHEQDA